MAGTMMAAVMRKGIAGQEAAHEPRNGYGHGDTAFETPDGDPLGIDIDGAAGYVVLHYLSDALGKMTKPENIANSR